MKRALLFCLGAMVVGGCASVDRMEATHQAIDRGLIEGLSSSNHYTATVWQFPGKPLGPYSKVGGLTASLSDGANAGQIYVFYLGKSRETKNWEVFATMVWRDGKWQPVPVKLMEASK